MVEILFFATNSLLWLPASSPQRLASNYSRGWCIIVVISARIYRKYLLAYRGFRLYKRDPNDNFGSDIVHGRDLTLLPQRFASL